MRGIIVFLSAAAAIRVQGLIIQEPPTAYTCRVLVIRWTGGVAPFILKIQSGDNPMGPPLRTFDKIATSPYQWSVDLPANTGHFFHLRDSVGATDDTETRWVVADPCPDGFPPLTLGPTAAPATSRGPIPSPNPTATLIISPLVDSFSASGSSITSTTTNASNSISLISIPGASSSTTSSATTSRNPTLPFDTSGNPTSTPGGNVGGNLSFGPIHEPVSSPNMAVIKGIAIGGSIALIIALVGLYLCLRHRRSLKLTDQLHSTDPIVSPYRLFRSVHPRARLGERFRRKMGRPTPSANEELITGTSANEDLPPAYGESNGGHSEQNDAGVEEAERERTYDEIIGEFCAAHRDLISPALEVKLHAARYLPENNPSDVSSKRWRRAYGIDFFGLRRLQMAYDRHIAAQEALDAPVLPPQIEPVNRNAEEKRGHFSGRG